MEGAPAVGLKTKILAVAAAVTLAGGISAAAGAAHAATPSCGSHCLDVFSKKFGTFDHPGFVLDTLRQGARVGQPQILFPAGNTDPAEDYTASIQGTTSDFFAAGLVSAAVELHYGGAINVTKPAGDPAFPDDPAFELEYAPFGVNSGLCVGLARTAFKGEGVSLQPCGVSAKTVWILDIPLQQLQQSDGCPLNPLYFLEAPLINGSDTNFSHPFVLTYPASGFPTDRPRQQLFVSNLTGFSQTGGTGSAAVCGTNSVAGPNDNQEWAAVTGVLTR
jgi:hypothetical protein